MTEIVAYQPPTTQTTLSEQMDYARAVSTGALLPDAYRNKPADILIAVGLGAAMGLSPAESLYRINVIQGKPTASAELIAANVRKAGHKLRVRTTDEPSATATIVRADDPDFEFTITRDKAWAQSMGLTGKDNYKRQPETMLQWRAITAVARLACPEALYGVAYSSDEMYDDTTPRQSSVASVEPTAPAPNRMRAILGTTPEPPEPVSDPATGAQPGEGEVSPFPTPDPSPAPEELPIEPEKLNTRGARAKRMFALFGELGIKDEKRHEYVTEHVDRLVTTSKDMTVDECETVIRALENDLEHPFEEGA